MSLIRGTSDVCPYFHEEIKTYVLVRKDILLLLPQIFEQADMRTA